MTGRLYRGSLHLTIPLVDELELRWFYSSPALSFGGCMDAKSSLGAQLEKAELLAYRTEECRRCRGTGYVRVVPWLKRKHQTHMTEYMKLLELYEKDEQLPPLMDTCCDACQGMGWVARQGHRNNSGEITVHFSETASSGATGTAPQGPDLELADRYRRIQSKVTSMAKASGPKERLLDLFLTAGCSEEDLWGVTTAGLLILSLPRKVRDQGPKAYPDLAQEAEEQAQNELSMVSEVWRQVTGGTAQLAAE